jgi:hypothetical protein
MHIGGFRFRIFGVRHVDERKGMPFRKSSLIPLGAHPPDVFCALTEGRALPLTVAANRKRRKRRDQAVELCFSRWEVRSRHSGLCRDIASCDRNIAGDPEVEGVECGGFA